MAFYTEIAKYYDVIFPLTEVKEQFIRDIIFDNNIKTMMDIGCATGALCGNMAKHLDKVEGFDLDETMVARAKMFYKYNNLTFKVGNMLELNQLYDETFDMVTCFGNTLVHIGKENIENVFRGVYNKLNNNGYFVFQVLNYDHIYAQHINKLPAIDNEVISFDRYYKYDTKKIVEFKTILTIKESGKQFENTIDLYPLFKDEMNTALKEVGFSEVTYYKNYNGDLYEGNHLPLIVKAKK